MTSSVTFCCREKRKVSLLQYSTTPNWRAWKGSRLYTEYKQLLCVHLLLRLTLNLHGPTRPVIQVGTTVPCLPLYHKYANTHTHPPTNTLTALKSESTSESSRFSSSGTFLFFSRCSSRLFWGRTDNRTKEIRQNLSRDMNCGGKAKPKIAAILQRPQIIQSIWECREIVN